MVDRDHQTRLGSVRQIGSDRQWDRVARGPRQHRRYPASLELGQRHQCQVQIEVAFDQAGRRHRAGVDLSPMARVDHDVDFRYGHAVGDEHR